MFAPAGDGDFNDLAFAHFVPIAHADGGSCTRQLVKAFVVVETDDDQFEFVTFLGRCFELAERDNALIAATQIDENVFAMHASNPPLDA